MNRKKRLIHYLILLKKTIKKSIRKILYWKQKLKQARSNMLRFLCTVVKNHVAPKLHQQQKYPMAAAMQRIASFHLQPGKTAKWTLDDFQGALGTLWFWLSKAQEMLEYDEGILQFIMRAYNPSTMKPMLPKADWELIETEYAKELTLAEAATRGR